MHTSTPKQAFRTLLTSLALAAFASAAFAATISGTVNNRTTGKPSAGDTVAVINTMRSMDEIAKTTTDASGKFHVDAPDGGQILLHITHKGAEYFKSVPTGANSVDIDVYDSAPKVTGISGEAIVLRAETDSTGKTLQVSENFFVQNASNPPRTEFGGNTLDFYLPKGAQVTQSLASTPGGLPTNGQLTTIDAAQGHYAFSFPIRPGETSFQVVYNLPYNGKQSFALKLSIPTDDVAVMLPKTMQFDGGSQFQPINPDPNAQSYDAHKPAADAVIQFTVAGSGQLPQSPEGNEGGAQSADQSGGAAQMPQSASSQRPGGGLGAPDDPNGTNDTLSKYKWWIIGLLGLALAGGAGFMLKSGPAPAATGEAVLPAASYAAPTAAYAAPSIPASTNSATLTQALKDELFALETDRLAGTLTEAEYAQHKAAFDLILKRLLNRSA